MSSTRFPGGSTYCALAALHLAKLDIPEPDKTTAWLLQRQACPAPQLLLEEEQDNDSEDEDTTPEEKAQLEMQAALKAASIAGFQGRAHKDPDACYSWWIKASLRVSCDEPRPASTTADSASRRFSIPRNACITARKRNRSC